MTRFRVVKALLVGLAIVGASGLLASIAIRAYGAHELARVSERYQREVGPLSLYDIARKKVAVEQNAVTWQRPGVLAVVFFPNDSSLVGSLSAKRFSTWSAEDAARLEAVLARNRPAIELLEHSRGMTSSNWDIPYEQGTTAKLPNLLAAINAAKMLNARGRLALGRGDPETALASAETLSALARSHEAERSLIMLLIGLAIEKLQLALVNDLATAPMATPAELDRLEASLCDADLKRAARESIRAAAAANVRDVQAETTLEAIHAPVPSLFSGALTNLVAAAMIEASLAADKEAGRPVNAPLAETDSAERERGWWASTPTLR
jgi:hypothetical protein